MEGHRAIFYSPRPTRRPTAQPWYWFSDADMYFVRIVYKRLRASGEPAGHARRLVLILAGCEVVR